MRAMWRAVALAFACLIAAAPVAHAQLITGTALTASGAVTSITGTADQVVASAATGPVTLSLPQSIATSSIPQFAGLGIGGAGASGQILNAVGTAAAPSYSFVGDTGLGLYRPFAAGVAFAAGGEIRFLMYNTDIVIPGGNPLSWGNTGNQYLTSGQATDVLLWRGAANTLSLRNGTNAQALWVANTWTSASVLEYLRIAFVSNVARIGTAHVGATARVLTLDYGGTSTAAISIPITSGGIAFGGSIGIGGVAAPAVGAGLPSSTFAALGTPADGTVLYCSNCDPVAVLTCTAVAGQTGALAFRVNGAWKCAG